MAVALTALVGYRHSLHPSCLSPLTRLQRELLLTNKQHTVPALPRPGHKKHTASFVPRPELIAVVVWRLTWLLFSYLNGPLLLPTLPQRLL